MIEIVKKLFIILLAVFLPVLFSCDGAQKNDLSSGLSSTDSEGNKNISFTFSLVDGEGNILEDHESLTGEFFQIRTAGEKRFLLTFSEAVDNKSGVEANIKNNTRITEFTFEWKTDKELLVSFNTEIMGDYFYYTVNPSGDAEKNEPVFTGEDILYSAAAPQKFFEWNTLTNEKREIPAPADDWIYSPVFGQIVDNNILIFKNFFNLSLYSLEGNETSVNDILSFRDFTTEYEIMTGKWLDAETALTWDHIDDKGILYSLNPKTLEKKPVFDISGELNEYLYPYSYFPSPDATKFAIGVYDDHDGSSFFLITDAKGNILNKISDAVENEWQKYFLYYDFSWIDHERIVFTGKEGTVIANINGTVEKRFDFVLGGITVDGESGNIAGFVRESDNLKYVYVFSDNNYEKTTEILSETRVNEENGTPFLRYVLLIHDGKLYLSRNNEIMIFDPATEKTKAQEGGYIFGVSKDGKSLYYVDSIPDLTDHSGPA